MAQLRTNAASEAESPRCMGLEARQHLPEFSAARVSICQRDVT